MDLFGPIRTLSLVATGIMTGTVKKNKILII